MRLVRWRVDVNGIKSSWSTWAAAFILEAKK